MCSASPSDTTATSVAKPSSSSLDPSSDPSVTPTTTGGHQLIVSPLKALDVGGLAEPNFCVTAHLRQSAAVRVTPSAISRSCATFCLAHVFVSGSSVDPPMTTMFARTAAGTSVLSVYSE